MNRFRLGAGVAILASVAVYLLDVSAFGIDWWAYLLYLVAGVLTLLWWNSTR